MNWTHEMLEIEMRYREELRGMQAGLAAMGNGVPVVSTRLPVFRGLLWRHLTRGGKSAATKPMACGSTRR